MTKINGRAIELSEGRKVSVFPLDTDDGRCYGLSFVNKEGEETHLGLTEEAARALCILLAEHGLTPKGGDAIMRMVLDKMTGAWERVN